MVTSGRGCAEQASLACGRRGGGRTQPALLVREMKYPLYQLLLSSKTVQKNPALPPKECKTLKRRKKIKSGQCPFSHCPSHLPV